jgi:hypothetical protein
MRAPPRVPLAALTTLLRTVQQAPGDERAKRARHEEAEGSSTGAPPDRQICPHEIVPDD